MGKLSKVNMMAFMLLLAFVCSSVALPSGVDETIMPGARREHNSDSSHIYGQFQHVKCCSSKKESKPCDCNKKNESDGPSKPVRFWDEDDVNVGPYTMRTGDGGDHTFAWRYTELSTPNGSSVGGITVPVPEEFLDEVADSKAQLDSNIPIVSEAAEAIKAPYDTTMANSVGAMFDKLEQAVKELSPFAKRYVRAKQRVEDFLAGKIERPGDGK